jgi:hypothetical protein
MNTDIEIGGNSAVELRKAVMTSYKGGIIPMWTSVLGSDAFPDQHLVPAAK